MNRWRRAGRIAVVLTSVWAVGCSRQLAVPGSPGTADTRHLPFDRVSDNTGFSPTAGLAPDGIPAGTVVTIRLQSAFSSADSRAGDSFQALLAEPLILDGKTLVARGTPVTGSVIAARASRGEHDPGYLRVTLATMTIDGKSIAVQTSSIFAKGGSYQRRKVPTIKSSDGDSRGTVAAVDSGHGNEASFSSVPTDARFSTGRRLTFRLAQPLHLAG